MEHLIKAMNQQERDEWQVLDEKIFGTANFDKIKRYETQRILLLEKARNRLKKRR